MTPILRRVLVVSLIFLTTGCICRTPPCDEAVPIGSDLVPKQVRLQIDLMKTGELSDQLDSLGIVQENIFRPAPSEPEVEIRNTSNDRIYESDKYPIVITAVSDTSIAIVTGRNSMGGAVSYIEYSYCFSFTTYEVVSLKSMNSVLSKTACGSYGFAYHYDKYLYLKKGNNIYTTKIDES